MKRTIISIALGSFLVGTTQEVFATEELPINHLEISQPSNRATVRYHFKSIPPLKYKGKNRIDYFPYDGGYTGVYLLKKSHFSLLVVNFNTYLSV
ncbi:hypothetical protein I6N95_15205 [Vagococcus sp. BWB3-3]|uniref:Uncharacterized protein n=1 Tax=Vagococcus allomyrinae TaxID=2794353 RepID=A0A940P6L3_9ENTE|nr:hypothetical protein [Vagococcus allomyrinae]MBP1042367.1 hypothetical protein [Vagococcus allomyrinae]